MSVSSLNLVNSKQLEAIKAINGPVMVVAGPGSGKTRVLTYRVAHLIQAGVPTYQILALTFTNKAAAEMRDRIIALVGEKSRHIWMGTFHSLFARLLRMECEKLGFSKNFSIYDTQDSLGLIKFIMNDLGISSQQFNPMTVLSRISDAKNRLVTPDGYSGSARDIFEGKSGLVYKEYEKRLKKNNAMDFDDLLIKPIGLFRQNKKVLLSYQERFRFILVDEYQDTNHAQYILIKLLADKYRNICVVGDDAQSIYAFRGADIRNILEFEKDYPDVKIIRLEQNYRSSKTILTAADLVIKNNRDQIPKDLWTDNDIGDPIALLECDDDRDESDAIVQHIYNESHRLKLQFRHFAVMYRTNAQSRSIEDSLRRSGIPYTIIGGIEFYRRKEIKDVLAYLRLIVNPKDGGSFLRIINTPNRGLGEAAVERLRKYSEVKNLFLLGSAERADEIPALGAKAKSSLLAFAALIGKYEKLKDKMSVSEMSRSLVDEIGILHLLKEEGTPESLVRWENVQELLSAISEFSESEKEPSLEKFLQEVSLVSDVDRWDDKGNSVTLLTLHGAKGLEFPVVFITGLEEGLFPFYNSHPDLKDLEEERRLFYVGITRAMKKLFISRVRIRYRFGEQSYQEASRFLGEIDGALFQIISHTKGFHEPGSRPDHTIPRSKRKRRVEQSETVSGYFPDEMPDYETRQVENLIVGISVDHETFGKGKIVQISGVGDSMKTVVEFDSVGRKNLMVKFAHLKIL